MHRLDAEFLLQGPVFGIIGQSFCRAPKDDDIAQIDDSHFDRMGAFHIAVWPVNYCHQSAFKVVNRESAEARLLRLESAGQRDPDSLIIASRSAVARRTSHYTIERIMRLNHFVNRIALVQYEKQYMLQKDKITMTFWPRK